MSGYLTARVKSVLSADTLILTPANHAGSTAPVERQLSLAYVQSPRLSNNEVYAFDAREVLRKLLLNKVIRFKVLYSYPGFGGGKREFGDVKAPIFESLIEYLLEKGCVKVKETTDPVDEDYYLGLKEIQEKAKASYAGLWSNPHGINVTNELLYAEVEKSKASPINAIVEKVISGDRLLVRFLVSKTNHVVAPILIAGVKSPRTPSANANDGEPFGNESKYFVESHMLLRDIKVSVLGESTNGVLIGKIIYPAGNIAEKLLENGLAEIVDWQSSIIGSKEMSLLRASERLSKVAQKGIWKNQTTKNPIAVSSDDIFNIGCVIPVTIARIISTDTIVVRTKEGDKDYTVQISSLRAPRLSDPTQAPFVPLAKEYLRKKIIGKTLKISVDGVREKSEQFDERPIVSVIMNDNSNLSESIVKNGWATVIRHRRGDDDRSPVWDNLIELEKISIEKKVGMHGKLPPAERIVDASENSGRSKTFLATFSNRSKISAVVDHVSSPNRFRLILPKEGVKLVLVLGGLSNKSSKSPELAKAALDYANKKVLQRDVTIDIYNVDKVGGFIGNLYIAGQSLPLQYNLLSQGFYEIHDYSIEQTKFADQLWNAQEGAQKQKIGIWVDYKPEEENDMTSEVTQQVAAATITKKFFDIECNDISEEGLISFQIMNEESEKLIPFMEKFHEFHQNQPIKAVANKLETITSYPQALSGLPKKGDLVSAAYSKNGKFYRAKIISHEKSSRLYKVQHVDFGNFDEVSINSMRQLPSQFSLNVLPAQGHIGVLSFVDLPPSKPTNYLDDSLDYLFDSIVGKHMVAAEDKRNPAPGIEMAFTLYDASKVKSKSAESINKEMISEGWAIVHKILQPWEKIYKKEVDTLRQLENISKSQRKGCWEFGDIESDI